MADYFIYWRERALDQVREIPLGIYSRRSPEAAISRAGRAWSLADDCLIAKGLPGAAIAPVLQPTASSPLDPLSI